jgi:hypothetical protein
VTYRSLILALLCAAAAPAYSQVAFISHFSSPLYPPLARQAGIAGEATMTVRVSREGKVAVVPEPTATHPILAEEAKRCVETWSFTDGTQERKVFVKIYFGFSGAPVDSNPKTTVTADFAESSVHVYVTTNPAPMVRP